MSRSFVYWLTVAALAASSSCSRFHRGGKAQPPVIAAPPTLPPTNVENPRVPPPPKVDQAETPAVAPPVATQIPAKPPAPPKPAPKQPRKPVPARAQASAPVETPPAASTLEPLVLAPVLSSAQQSSLNRAIDAAVAQTESALASVASKQMSTTQQANADRARSFLEQARETRATDLTTAKTLAERAVVLAQSLAAELR